MENIKINTTQNVALSYTAAGVGPRMLAVLLDMIFRYSYYALLYYVYMMSRQRYGSSYYDSNIERIRHGDPVGIYGEGNQFYMFVRITMNNIRVSFLVFIIGLFTAFGSSLLLIYNGVMLGCFFTLFYQYNVLDKALKVVWIHGTLEISAIIIAGCAGFVLGNSYIFPGTHTRLQAFMRGGKDGLKIVVGLVPVFMMAGFLESFVTRYTNMPIALSLLIIGISFLFITGYFIVLPIYLQRKTNLNHA